MTFLDVQKSSCFFSSEKTCSSFCTIFQWFLTILGRFSPDRHLGVIFPNNPNHVFSRFAISVPFWQKLQKTAFFHSCFLQFLTILGRFSPDRHLGVIFPNNPNHVFSRFAIFVPFWQKWPKWPFFHSSGVDGKCSLRVCTCSDRVSPDVGSRRPLALNCKKFLPVLKSHEIFLKFWKIGQGRSFKQCRILHFLSFFVLFVNGNSVSRLICRPFWTLFSPMSQNRQNGHFGHFWTPQYRWRLAKDAGVHTRHRLPPVQNRPSS